ncbi:MAG TPA: ankyrin repeat domain-containing protein [Verrucomicrobiae bacterium]
MKTKLSLGILLLATALLPAQTTNLTALLQQGLFEEQASRNLDAAIADYSTLAAQFDKDRQLAATAVFRLGECYRAQGKSAEAAAQYQRVLRDFSDQTTLVTLSRQNLAGMGAAKTETSPVVASADAQLWKQVKDLPPAELEKTLPTLLPDATLDALLTQRSDAQLKRATLVVDYATNNPAVTRVDALLTELAREIGERVAGDLQALKLRAELPVNTPGVNGSGQQRDLLEDDQEIEQIEKLLQSSPDLVNKCDKSGNTLLSKAAVQGQVKVVNYLLDHGADVNAGWPALYQATRTGNRAMVELLLQRGADVNQNAEYGRTALTVAAEEGFISILELLLANKANPNVTDNRNGQTPLWLAMYKGHDKCVKLLLAAGANVDAEASDFLQPSSSPRQTSLSLATERGWMEMIKLLIAAKANPNAGAKNPPLLCAVAITNLEAAAILLHVGANPNAAAIGRFDDLHFVKNGDYQNYCSHMTPLWLAVYLNQPGLVQLLLKCKADPNEAQTDGKPIIFNALSKPEVLNTLIAAGATVEVRENTVKTGDGRLLGWTPLLLAVENGQSADIVETLLKHGANPNSRDEAFGQTPLHWVGGWGNERVPDLKVLELLLDYKADPNVRAESGQTPLARFSNWLGAGRTPADQKAVLKQCIELLRQHGAMDHAADWDRITVARSATSLFQPVFTRDTNGWNQFTLFDLLGMQYDLISTGDVPRSWTERYGFSNNGNPLAFPDFSRVVIHRPAKGGTNWTVIKVNVEQAIESGNCAANVALQFGDWVEIPEADHVLNESWTGLSTNQLLALQKCLTRHLQVTVNGQMTNLIVGPQIRTKELGYGAPQVLTVDELLTHEPLMLWPALKNSKLLLASSDLSRVTVTRQNSASGKRQKYAVDCSNPNSMPDIWLQDGDAIEVPAKQ